MAKGKKTVKVAEIRSRVNNLLARENLSQETKSVLCSILESILMDTNNYHGFNHIYWCNKGCKEWEDAGKPEDETKNQFIIGNLGEYARSYY